MATTIAQNLQILIDTKKDIKDAIEDKGMDMTGVPFTEYANKIADISGGGGEVDEYFYYSKAYYTITNNSALFANAWEHSLTVDPSAIKRNSYPNGEDNGVIIPDSVTSIGEDAFENWTSNDQPLVIPNSVTRIGQWAFQNWTSNNQPLVIPNSVTSIGGSAFSNWTSNDQPLVIGNGVTSIGASAFYNWGANNQPLVIPNSVTSIGYSAFYGWSLVPYIIMEREVPPTIVNTSFDNQNDAPIYVPHDSVDDYKTATNWTAYASRIKSINDKP